MISRKDFDTLRKGDKIKICDLETLERHRSTTDDMLRFANKVVTVKKVECDGVRIEEDRPNSWYWDKEIIVEIVERFDVNTLKPFEITAPQVHKIIITNNDRNDVYCNYMRLVKITDNLDKLHQAGNTIPFLQIIAGKWVLVNRYNYRVYNKFNPHIKQLLDDNHINDYRIDGYTYVIEGIEKSFDCGGFNFINHEIDFINGTIKALPKPENVCASCGNLIEGINTFGKYCRNCLTGYRGLAYRFGYHDYCGGYDTPQGVDTKKKLVFGCEIERDYDDDCDDFDENLENAMLQIIKDTQGEQLENGTLKREQVFMCDGSLCADGLEWITFPHTFEWYIKNKNKLDNALKNIKDYGFCATSSAGNHIHINRDFFINKKGEDESDFVACKMAIVISKYWNEFLHIANRENTSYTHKPSQNHTDSLFKAIEKTICGKDDHSVAVNLQHSRSIEIRLWSAIKNADDLLFYIDNEQALARYCKKTSFERVQACKLTDFMKYYKLPTSLEIARQRLSRYGTMSASEQVRKFMEEK